jgi:hypothetical protein
LDHDRGLWSLLGKGERASRDRRIDERNAGVFGSAPTVKATLVGDTYEILDCVGMVRRVDRFNETNQSGIEGIVVCVGETNPGICDDEALNRAWLSVIKISLAFGDDLDLVRTGSGTGRPAILAFMVSSARLCVARPVKSRHGLA